MPHVEISYSISFIANHLKLDKASILDIGCGDGQLSLGLTTKGANVTAIESDQELAQQARSIGIRILNMDYLQFEATAHFDAVLFSRSLHHIHQIDQALDKASEYLKNSGLVILEEFDLMHVNESTLNWYYELMGEKPNDVVRTWQDEHLHDPPLNSGMQMYESVKQRFKIVHFERCPYLFRSIGKKFEESPKKSKQILIDETNLINQGKILPVGLRVIGAKVT